MSQGCVLAVINVCHSRCSVAAVSGYLRNCANTKELIMSIMTHNQLIEMVSGDLR